MVATSSPCTNRLSFVIITTTDTLGCTSDVDCGISTPLRVLDDLDVGRVHEQECDHHRQDVDQWNQIELRIGTVMQMVLPFSPNTLPQRHDDILPLMVHLQPQCS